MKTNLAAHPGLRRLVHSYIFFLFCHLVLFLLAVLASPARAYSGEHFILYWFMGPVGSWMLDYFWLPFYLVLVYPLVVNPVLYSLLLYPVLWLIERSNKHNEIPSITNERKHATKS
jgi:hypothetical protein